LARTSTKKPATRRAPTAKAAVSKAAAGKGAARVVKAVATSIGEGAPKPVEWPVGAAKAAKKSEKTAVSPKVSVPPKMPVSPKITAQPKEQPAPKPIATAPAAALADPVAITPEAPPAVPIVTQPLIPAPASAAAATKGKFIMTDAMETAKTYAEEAKTRIQSAVSEMSEKTKVAMEKSSKAMEELGELTKGNYEAIVESSKIAAKGFETLGQEAVEFSRKSFEKSTSTFKSLAAVKSPAEFFQLQSELLSTAMDSFASEASKSSEAMLKLVGEISQPISNRVAIVSEKVKALAA